MQEDAHGNAITAGSEAAARAFDHLIDGYLRYRADTAGRLSRLLDLDAEVPLGHVMAGYAAMLSYDRSAIPRAEAALARAAALGGNGRERLHVAALRAWADGRPEAALDAWEMVLAEHPRDVLAFRLHHFNAFWMGMPERMLTAVERLLPHWSPSLPGWVAILACRCFAHEECGSYTVAEHAGRTAMALDPGNLWATHGVAHVLEMGGRRAEGLALLREGEPHWEGGNNLMHHLWWHAALFHLERGEFDEVLSLYDRRFRDHASLITQAAPDLYIDVQNAASMLWRLARQGVEVGSRWTELADKAEARVGDTLSAFTQPHWMMALAATGRRAAAHRLLEALDEAGRGNTEHARILREAASPACRAVLAHAEGRHADAVAALRPALGGLYRLGGSHAQQEVLEQLFLDAAVKAGLTGDVRLLLERVAGRHPVPPERRIGYAGAARGIGY
jgi:tetratricopeptide (TPR) repeat protein